MLKFLLKKLFNFLRTTVVFCAILYFAFMAAMKLEQTPLIIIIPYIMFSLPILLIVYYAFATKGLPHDNVGYVLGFLIVFINAAFTVMDTERWFFILFIDEIWLFFIFGIPFAISIFLSIYVAASFFAFSLSYDDFDLSVIMKKVVDKKWHPRRELTEEQKAQIRREYYDPMHRDYDDPPTKPWKM